MSDPNSPNVPVDAEEYSRMWQQLNSILAHVDVYRATRIPEADVPEELKQGLAEAIEVSRGKLAEVIGQVCASEDLYDYLGLDPEDVQAILSGGKIPEDFLDHFENEIRSFRDNLIYYVRCELAS